MDEFKTLSEKVFGAPEVVSTLGIENVPISPPESEEVIRQSFELYHITVNGYSDIFDYDKFLLQTTLRLQNIIRKGTTKKKKDEIQQYLLGCLDVLNAFRRRLRVTRSQEGGKTVFHQGERFRAVDPLTVAQKQEMWPKYDGSEVPEYKFKFPDHTSMFYDKLQERLERLVDFVEDLLENGIVVASEEGDNRKVVQSRGYYSFKGENGAYGIKPSLEDVLNSLFKKAQSNFDRSTTAKQFREIFMGHKIDPSKKLVWTGFKGDLGSFVKHMPDELAGWTRSGFKNEIAAQVFKVKEGDAEPVDFTARDIGGFTPTNNDQKIRGWYESLPKCPCNPRWLSSNFFFVDPSKCQLKQGTVKPPPCNHPEIPLNTLI